MWYCNMRIAPLLFILLAVGCMQVNSDSNVGTVIAPPASTSQATLPTADETEILVEGVAAIEFQGGAAKARDNALDHALRSAVEQAVGTYITSETQVSNFQLISDNIYSHTSGYVSSYQIVNESENNGLYRIVLRAIVKTENIENDLTAIGILLSEQARPRVMVVIKELNHISELANPEILMNNIMFETLILDHFRAKGFQVVNAATVADLIKKDQLKLILEGDEAAATLLGLQAGAEIIITGTVTHSEENRMIAGSFRKIHQFQVSSRAINTVTGGLFAGSAITVQLPFSESQAREQAAQDTSEELISAILNSWIQQENTTVIVLSNADFNKVQTLRSELQLKIRGISDVITRDFAGTRATLEIISETSSSQVIDEMTSGNLDIEFQVTGVSGNRLDITFTD